MEFQSNLACGPAGLSRARPRAHPRAHPRARARARPRARARARPLPTATYLASFQSKTKNDTKVSYDLVSILRVLHDEFVLYVGVLPFRSTRSLDMLMYACLLRGWIANGIRFTILRAILAVEAMLILSVYFQL
jgi:hypothetical protein